MISYSSRLKLEALKFIPVVTQHFGILGHEGQVKEHLAEPSLC